MVAIKHRGLPLADWVARIRHFPVAASALLLFGMMSPAGYALEDRPLPDPEPMSREEMIRMIDDALPSLIGDNNSELVKQMMGARLGLPISENLKIDESLRTIFGRQRPNFDPDCQRDQSISGDPSPDQCTAFIGEVSGGGAYQEFAWDKQLGFGNVHYLRRNADSSTAPGQLPAVQISDEEAFETAVKFLVETMGIPPEEVPRAPDNARNRFPVRTLVMGEVTPQTQRTIPVMKLVQIQRGLLVNLRDPATGRDIPYLHGPGEAFVLLNDSGIWQARVQQWRELESVDADAARAKTRAQLVNEIADSVMQNNARVVSLHANLTLQAMDLKPGSPSADALMVPGLEISVAVVPRDPSEEEQAQLGPSTAGEGLIFSLLDIPEDNLRGDVED